MHRGQKISHLRLFGIKPKSGTESPDFPRAEQNPKLERREGGEAVEQHHDLPQPANKLSLFTMAAATMASKPSRAIASLTAAFRSLAVARVSPSLAQRQTRSLSHSILARNTRPTVTEPALSIPARVLPKSAQPQQARGMKVQSSIKKRCEHCKVRDASDTGDVVSRPRRFGAIYWPWKPASRRRKLISYCL